MRKWIVIAPWWARGLLWALVVSAAVLAWLDVALTVGVITPGSRICQEAAQSDKEQCTSYGVALVSITKAAEFLDEHEGTLTAFATIVLAFFTWRLWWSTNKLWETTRDSVNLAREEFESIHRPRIRIKHIWLDQPIRASSRVDIRPVIANSGDLPARLMAFDIVVHGVRDGETPPNNPYLDRFGNPRNFQTFPQDVRLLRSGIPLDMGARQAASGADITVDLIDRVQHGHSRVYCFGYIDYTNDKETGPNTRLMRTSFCRVFQRSRDGNMDELRGAFVPCHHHTEHEYQD